MNDSTPDEALTPTKSDTRNIVVPRDPDVDGSPGASTDQPPPANSAGHDEGDTTRDHGLIEGSPPAEALHRRPPERGQLTTGSGGDAARPGKEGIHGKPVPPRGHM